MTWYVTWVVLVAVVVSMVRGLESGDVVFVKPEVPVRGLKVFPAPHAPLYIAVAAADLQRHATYEVSVSYPATNPASFVIELVGPRPAVAGARRLLNAQQWSFDTDTPLPVHTIGGVAAHVFAITVVPEGVPATGNAAQRVHLVDVALSRKVFGLVPLRSLPVLVFGCFLVVVALSLAFFGLRMIRSVLLPSNDKSDD
jgi:hypothetical protein